MYVGLHSRSISRARIVALTHRENCATSGISSKREDSRPNARNSKLPPRPKPPPPRYLAQAQLADDPHRRLRCHPERFDDHAHRRERPRDCQLHQFEQP